VNLSEIKLSSIPFHSNTRGLKWIHMHPNKPSWMMNPSVTRKCGINKIYALLMFRFRADHSMGSTQFAIFVSISSGESSSTNDLRWIYTIKFWLTKELNYTITFLTHNGFICSPRPLPNDQNSKIPQSKIQNARNSLQQREPAAYVGVDQRPSP
jgi:hypothetical protein